MITRSKRDASYEYFELPDTRKRQKKETSITHKPEEQSQEQERSQEQEQHQEQEQAKSLSPNITIAYYERPPLYEVNIDFDEAHNEWIKNKVKLQNGCYRYKRERKSIIKWK